MKICREENLRNFGFWSGALDIANILTTGEFDTIECILEDLYPEGLTETELNDLFWFEPEWVAELLGTTEDEILARERF